MQLSACPPPPRGVDIPLKASLAALPGVLGGACWLPTKCVPSHEWSVSIIHIKKSAPKLQIYRFKALKSVKFTKSAKFAVFAVQKIANS